MLVLDFQKPSSLLVAFSKTLLAHCLHMNLYLNHVYATLITITFVWFLFFIKACIFLRPSLVSFLPTSFVPPHKTTTYFFVSFSLSPFTVFVHISNSMFYFWSTDFCMTVTSNDNFVCLFSDTCFFLQLVAFPFSPTCLLVNPSMVVHCDLLQQVSIVLLFCSLLCIFCAV